MGLETATYINGLVNTNPTAGDPVSQGDDHLRLIKSTILSTFPNISGAMTLTHTQLNQLDVKSLASSGYQKTPSGLIIQWGSGVFSDATSATFPIAFPTACLQLVIGPANYDNTKADYQKVVAIAAYNTTTTGFTASSSRGVLTGALAGTWIAVGY